MRDLPIFGSNKQILCQQLHYDNITMFLSEFKEFSNYYQEKGTCLAKVALTLFI